MRGSNHVLTDDGVVPNNAVLPLKIYRGAFETEAARDPAHIIAHLAANGWGGAWINGIYDFQHYHATAHEVLVIAAGSADVQFGGPSGPVLTVAAGDAVLIPAGVGHCRTSHAPGLVVIGAYPAGQENPDLRRATTADRTAALALIPHVARPGCDPVLGGGPPWP
jgi:uncharacterized protein YjlB